MGLVSPHLFVEKFSDETLNKLPNISLKVVYNTKNQGEPLVKLRFFCSYPIPAYQINNLQEQISSIAITLRDELIDRIEDAQHSGV